MDKIKVSTLDDARVNCRGECKLSSCEECGCYNDPTVCYRYLSIEVMTEECSFCNKPVYDSEGHELSTYFCPMCGRAVKGV